MGQCCSRESRDGMAILERSQSHLVPRDRQYANICVAPLSPTPRKNQSKNYGKAMVNESEFSWLDAKGWRFPFAPESSQLEKQAYSNHTTEERPRTHYSDVSKASTIDRKYTSVDRNPGDAALSPTTARSYDAGFLEGEQAGEEMPDLRADFEQSGTPVKPRPAFVPPLPLKEKGIEGQFGR